MKADKKGIIMVAIPIIILLWVITIFWSKYLLIAFLAIGIVFLMLGLCLMFLFGLERILSD